MTIRYVMTLTAICLGAAAGSAIAAQDEERNKTFSQLDVDSDLRISADEANADSDVISQFAALDANQDGYLNSQEFAQLDRGDRDYQ